MEGSRNNAFSVLLNAWLSDCWRWRIVPPVNASYGVRWRITCVVHAQIMLYTKHSSFWWKSNERNAAYMSQEWLNWLLRLRRDVPYAFAWATADIRLPCQSGYEGGQSLVGPPVGKTSTGWVYNKRPGQLLSNTCHPSSLRTWKQDEDIQESPKQNYHITRAKTISDA